MLCLTIAALQEEPRVGSFLDLKKLETSYTKNNNPLIKLRGAYPESIDQKSATHVNSSKWKQRKKRYDPLRKLHNCVRNKAACALRSSFQPGEILRGFTDRYGVVACDKDSSAYVMSAPLYMCEIDANMARVGPPIGHFVMMTRANGGWRCRLGGVSL